MALIILIHALLWKLNLSHNSLLTYGFSKTAGMIKKIAAHVVDNRITAINKKKMDRIHNIILDILFRIIILPFSISRVNQ